MKEVKQQKETKPEPKIYVANLATYNKEIK